MLRLALTTFFHAYTAFGFHPHVVSTFGVAVFGSIFAHFFCGRIRAKPRGFFGSCGFGCRFWVAFTLVIIPLSLVILAPGLLFVWVRTDFAFAFLFKPTSVGAVLCALFLLGLAVNTEGTWASFLGSLFTTFEVLEAICRRAVTVGGGEKDAAGLDLSVLFYPRCIQFPFAKRAHGTTVDTFGCWFGLAFTDWTAVAVLDIAVLAEYLAQAATLLGLGCVCCGCSCWRCVADHVTAHGAPTLVLLRLAVSAAFI